MCNVSRCCKNSDRTFHAVQLVALQDIYKVFVANLKRIDVMISWPYYLRMLLCITKVLKGYKYVITFLLAMNFLVFGQDYENDDLFNALTAVVALMTLIDFTLSYARRFYSSMGNPSAVKGLKA